MLRYIVGGATGLIAVLAVSFVGVIAGSANDWPLGDIRAAISKLQNYLPGRSFLNGPRGDGDAVVVIKLGLGIPYCKGHAATIAVRDKRGFRKVAVSRTLRGVTARTIGLTAARLDAGTYYVVHGRCHVARRAHNVGKRLGRGRNGQTRNGQTRFATSYAKFTIKSGEVLNAGFLRFFPTGRGRGLRIKLQKIPRQDLRFLKRRYRKLSEDLVSRLMQRTKADGSLLHAPRFSRPVGRKRVPPKQRPVRRDTPVQPARAPVVRQPRMTPEPVDPVKPKLIPFKPIPFKPGPRNGVPAIKAAPKTQPVVRTPAPPSSSMTLQQRRAACEALLQLKRDGKVKALPVTCLNLTLPGDENADNTGLPPASGVDK